MAPCSRSGEPVSGSPHRSLRLAAGTAERPGPTPSSSQGSAISSPSTSPRPCADSVALPARSEPWGELAVAPIQPVATLTATKIARAGVAADTAFTLASIGTDDPQALARALEVTPALDLAISAGPADRTATLRPTGALLPGQLYRFTLRAPDGTISGSWAFQAQSPLRVVTTLPYNRATDVPVTTGIELTFDQDGAVDAASHFSIEPAVKGRFEQHGRTFVFVPERLEPATLYTVTLGRGVRLEGSDLPLEEDVVVRFETAPPRRQRRNRRSRTSSARRWSGARAIGRSWRSGSRASAPTNEEQQALREATVPCDGLPPPLGASRHGRRSAR